MNYQKAKSAIDNGGLVVLTTDTIHGIHADAFNKTVVEKVYDLKGRSYEKPFIILISSIENLELFDIKVDKNLKEFLSDIWPAKVSVILPCKKDKFSYLHRGKYSLAFRIPDKKDLRELISKTGPLISTSVNREGDKPAKTINQAKKYFGDKIDLYVDEGKTESSPSTVVKIKDKDVEIVRKGAVDISHPYLN